MPKSCHPCQKWVLVLSRSARTVCHTADDRDLCSATQVLSHLCLKMAIQNHVSFVSPNRSNPKSTQREMMYREGRVLKRAVINRYGFNSDGIDAVSKRLSLFRTTHPSGDDPLVRNGFAECMTLDVWCSKTRCEFGSEQIECSRLESSCTGLHIGRPETGKVRGLHRHQCLVTQYDGCVTLTLFKSPFSKAIGQVCELCRTRSNSRCS